jgi:hypothetical protein
VTSNERPRSGSGRGDDEGAAAIGIGQTVLAARSWSARIAGGSAIEGPAVLALGASAAKRGQPRSD